jgi:hypothetical protein
VACNVGRTADVAGVGRIGEVSSTLWKAVMPDQPTHHATHYTPTDPGRVDTLNPTEMHYWCEQFHCSESALTDAVARVGTHVAALREHFGHGTAPHR